MTKQEFLNMEKKTPADTIAGHLLVTQSATSLKEIQRALNRITKVLYTDAAKSTPYKEVLAGVDKAIFYVHD